MIKAIFLNCLYNCVNSNSRKKTARCVFVRTKTILPSLWLGIKPSRLRSRLGGKADILKISFCQKERKEWQDQ